MASLDGAHGHPDIEERLLELETGVVDNPPPPPPPPPPPALAGVYGPAIAGDTKSNIQVGWTDRARVAHRFVTTSPSPVVAVRIALTGGPTYSGGTGGAVRARIPGDAAGYPGDPLGAYGPAHTPGNPGSGRWSTFPRLVVPGPVVPVGTLLYAVFDNPDVNLTANYCSVTDLLVRDTPGRVQPRFPDGSWATFESAGAWRRRGETPVMDVEYADGSHSGQAYIGMIGAEGMDVLAATIGGAAKVRQTMGPGRTLAVAGAAIRCRRDHGDDPLFLTLRSMTGVALAEGTVLASAIAQSAAGLDNGGAVWAIARWPSVPFGGGELRLSCAQTSAYTVAPIREGIAEGFAPSLGFPDGQAERSPTGSTWSPLYPGVPLDLQTYLILG